jgi:hypothetical protein
MAQLDKLITVIGIKELVDGAVKSSKHDTQPDYQN